jgi:hypothetical protein
LSNIVDEFLGTNGPVRDRACEIDDLNVIEAALHRVAEITQAIWLLLVVQRVDLLVHFEQ